jgi:hypothetical protein
VDRNGQSIPQEKDKIAHGALTKEPHKLSAQAAAAQASARRIPRPDVQ